MIHTFTLACKVDSTIIDKEHFYNTLRHVSHKTVFENNSYKYIFLNDNLSATLSKDEMESMPTVIYEHYEFNSDKKNKKTGEDDYILIEINYQKSIADKKYLATPIGTMKYGVLQMIMDLVCKAIPIISELNIVRKSLTAELKSQYKTLYGTDCMLSEVELYSQMATTPNQYIQNSLRSCFTDEGLDILSTPTVSDSAKMEVINSTLSLLNEFKVRRIDYTLDILTDYKYIYMELLANGMLPANMQTKHKLYYGVDENGDSIIKSKQAKTKTVSINFYDKEYEMNDKQEPIPMEDEKQIHDTLRLEIQVHRRRINYLRKKSDSTVEQRLIKDLMDIAVEENELGYYLSKVIAGGQYYTYKNAIQLIQNRKFKADKCQKLCKVIYYVAKNHGISNFLDKVANGVITDCGKLSSVQGYLRELQNMGINPVTISRTQAKRMKAITPTYQISNLGNYVHGKDYLLNPLVYLQMQQQKELNIQNELMNPNSELVCSLEQE